MKTDISTEKQLQNKAIVSPILGNEAGASLPVKTINWGSEAKK